MSAQLVTLTGFQYAIFKYNQERIRSSIKRAIKEGVSEDDLVDFRFHIQEENWINLEWTKPDKEFRFNNQMYDVVKRSEKEDTVYFRCIHDVKESGLFQQLEQMTNNRSRKGKSLVVYWSKQNYFPMNGFIDSFSLFEEIKKTSIPAYKKPDFHLFVESPKPPPPQV